MTRVIMALALVWAVAGQSGRAQSPPAAPPADLSGSWALNTGLSDHPQQVGFGGDGPDDAGDRGARGGRPGGGGSGGGFGGRGGFGRGGFGGGRGGDAAAGRARPSQGSSADRLRVLELSDEIRNPPATLTISQKGAAVSITDDQNRTRTFRTDGKKDTQQLEAVKVDTKATWDGAQLVVDYDVGNGRTIRYTYSVSEAPHQLIVTTAFVAGQKKSQRTSRAATRVYDSTMDAARTREDRGAG